MLLHPQGGSIGEHLPSHLQRQRPLLLMITLDRRFEHGDLYYVTEEMTMILTRQLHSGKEPCFERWHHVKNSGCLFWQAEQSAVLETALLEGVPYVASSLLPRAVHS